MRIQKSILICFLNFTAVYQALVYSPLIARIIREYSDEGLLRISPLPTALSVLIFYKQILGPILLHIST